VDVLLIGGTRFTGPKLVEQLASAGHQLTLFNRGTHELATDHDVARVSGDRRNEADAKEFFATRSFDAVVDTCAFEPADVTALFQADCDPERYVCYSTTGVYPEARIVSSRGTDERGENPFWGAYGIDKAALEDRLFGSIESLDGVGMGVRIEGSRA
jgi:nucleoside-diphosphate-sugar epimerase